MSEVREASNVVTSENSAEFYAQKLGLATEAEPEATTEETSDDVEPVEVEAEAEVESEPKVEEDAPTTDKKQNPKQIGRAHV